MGAEYTMMNEKIKFLYLNIIKLMEIVYYTKPKFTHKTKTINMVYFIFH